MLIDLFTERYCFSGQNAILSVFLYALAALTALLLRRLGQFIALKKTGTAPRLSDTLLSDLGGSLWATVLFVLTGCLKGPIKQKERGPNRENNQRQFVGGVVANLCATALSFVLYTAMEWLLSFTGWEFWAIGLLLTKALTCANLSILIFSLLPLPGSDAEILLRASDFGPKGVAFREGGTWPFFLFCVLSLLLACIAIPFVNGEPCSLSGIITLFPILLIGG